MTHSVEKPLPAPPRQVPWVTQIQILFGASFSQFGFVFFAFGMFFFWAFVPYCDCTSWFRFKGPLEKATGRVLASSKTHGTEGGSKNRPGIPIYRNEFAFTVQGNAYRGTSFAAGQALPAGQSVTVEYVPQNPSAARIQGMRANVFDASAVAVIIFPLIGVGLFGPGLVRGIRALPLLRKGCATFGKLYWKERTKISINRRPQYAFTFNFTTHDGSTASVVAKDIEDRFPDQAKEQIVYDPSWPQRALVVGNLPGKPQIGADGCVICAIPSLGVPAAILPAIILLGNAGWALWLLVR